MGHEDDDLLFLSPDVLHDVQSDRCVTTVYLTAGDDGGPSSYWQGREAGVEAAYASMAGVSNSWSPTTLSVTDSDNVAHSIVMQTLDGDQNVSLIFMRLPDGNEDGSGFPSDSYESLKKLWTGNSSTRVHPVDGSSPSGYSNTGLESVLTSFMNQFQPDIIRTQDYVNPGVLGSNDDHSDHQATGLLTYTAQQTYTTSHTIIPYFDYDSPVYPQNVNGADLTSKQNAFYQYGADDPQVDCTSTANCSAPHAAWLERQYTVPYANAGPDRTVSTDATVQLDGSTSFDAYNNPLTYKWTQTYGPTAGLTGADTAKLSFTAPADTATLTFELTVNDGKATSTDSVAITVAADMTNVASQATMTASSPNPGTDQSADKANDGFTDGDPLGDASHEWATDGGKDGNWLNLAWSSPQRIAHVVLYDRPNSDDQIKSATLTFSDGSSVPVSELPNDGSPLTVSFAARSTTSLRLTITSVSSTTQNIGLAEIEVWTDRPPVANAGPDQTVNAASPVTLNGSASSDPDSGDTLSYKWTQTGGSPTVSLSSDTVSNPTFTAPASAASLTFKLTVSDGMSDGTLSNSDYVTITVKPVSDLSITKTDHASNVNAGSTVSYTIVASNAGPSDASGAVFKDAVLANLAVSNVSCGSASGGAACPAPSDTTKALMQGAGIVIPTLPNGGSVTFTVTGSAGSGAQIANVATVAAPSGTTDPSASNNTATDTDTIIPVSDLSITKTDHASNVNAGSTVSYTIVASNSGPSAASGAVFKDAVLANLAVSNVSCGSASGGAACPAPSDTTKALMQGAGIVIPTLPNGGSVTFTVTGSAGSGAQIANVATVAAPSGTTDPSPATATDTDTVNRPPVANAGQDKTVNVGATVMLDGSSSSDPDHDTLSYKWTQTDGAPVSLSSDTVRNPTFTAPASAASLTFKLTVSDGTSQSDPDYVTITVNRLPVANAGPDQTVNAGDSVRLDGTSSSDPDHHTLSYKWTQTGGSPTVSLSSDTVPNPTFTAPASSASLTFKLTVSDGKLSNADTVLITVVKKANPAAKVYKRPQTKLVKMKILSAKRTAIFRFSGSRGKGKLSFQCKLDKGKYKSCRSGKSYKHLKPGKHVFRVRAKDATGKVDLSPATKRFKI